MADLLWSAPSTNTKDSSFEFDDYLVHQGEYVYFTSKGAPVTYRDFFLGTWLGSASKKVQNERFEKIRSAGVLDLNEPWPLFIEDFLGLTIRKNHRRGALYRFDDLIGRLGGNREPGSAVSFCLSHANSEQEAPDAQVEIIVYENIDPVLSSITVLFEKYAEKLAKDFGCTPKKEVFPNGNWEIKSGMALGIPSPKVAPLPDFLK